MVILETITLFFQLLGLCISTVAGLLIGAVVGYRVIGRKGTWFDLAGGLILGGAIGMAIGISLFFLFLM